MANALSNLSVAELKRALRIKEQIETLERELGQVLGVPTAAPRPRAGRKPQKRIWTSAERARNAAYQRARRARLKAGRM